MVYGIYLLSSVSEYSTNSIDFIDQSAMDLELWLWQEV